MFHRPQLLLGLFIVSLFIAIPTAVALQNETEQSTETEKADTPKAETPNADAPKAETPKADTPKAETEDTADTKKPETPEADTKKTETEEPPAAEAGAEDFGALFEQWKGVIAELRALQNEYKIAKPEDRAALVEKFNGLIAQGDALAPRLREAAEAAFLADPQTNPEVGNFRLNRRGQSGPRQEYRGLTCGTVVDRA